MTMRSKVNLLPRETIYVKEYLEFWVYINVKGKSSDTQIFFKETFNVNPVTTIFFF